MHGGLHEQDDFYIIRRLPSERLVSCVTVPSRAIRCGILPERRLVQPGVLYFILFYFAVRVTEAAYRGSLGVEGGKSVLQGVHIVVLSSDEWLASEVIQSSPFGWLELFMVRPAAGRVYKPPRYSLHLQVIDNFKAVA